MPLPLSLWYALRMGHTAHGALPAGGTVLIRTRSGPGGESGYEVVTADGAREGHRCATSALGNHKAVFNGDGPLCDYLYANGLDPVRLTVGASPTRPDPTPAPRRRPHSSHLLRTLSP